MEYQATSNQESQGLCRPISRHQTIDLSGLDAAPTLQSSPDFQLFPGGGAYELEGPGLGLGHRREGLPLQHHFDGVPV